jgi:peroxiredoxin Q/BCP
VLAVSMDDRETLAKFKASLKAPFAFIPDTDGKLTRLYKVKTPVLDFALRYTFLIGPGRTVLQVDHGKDAVDPSSTIVACSLPTRAPKG